MNFLISYFLEILFNMEELTNHIKRIESIDQTISDYDIYIDKCIKKNNFEDFCKIFEMSEIFIYPNYRYWYFTEWLAYIIKEGTDTRYIDFLLEKGARINQKITNENLDTFPKYLDLLPSFQRYKDKYNLIEICIKYKRDIILKKILEQGAIIDYTRNLLYIISLDRSIKCFEILLENNFNINFKTKENVTLLHFCATHCNLPLIKRLVDLNVKTNIRDNDGETPLDILEGWDDKDTEMWNLINNLYKRQRKRKVNEMKNEDCVFCLEVLTNEEKNLFITKCNHYYHKKCWEKYTNKSSCPLCRGKI